MYRVFSLDCPVSSYTVFGSTHVVPAPPSTVLVPLLCRYFCKRQTEFHAPFGPPADRAHLLSIACHTAEPLTRIFSISKRENATRPEIALSKKPPTIPFVDTRVCRPSRVNKHFHTSILSLKSFSVNFNSRSLGIESSVSVSLFF